MPNKPEFVHLLKIARSVEAQNDAIGRFVMTVGAVADILSLDMTEAAMGKAKRKLKDAAQVCRDAVWPEEG